MVAYLLLVNQSMQCYMDVAKELGLCGVWLQTWVFYYFGLFARFSFIGGLTNTRFSQQCFNYWSAHFGSMDAAAVVDKCRTICDPKPNSMLLNPYKLNPYRDDKECSQVSFLPLLSVFLHSEIRTYQYYLFLGKKKRDSWFCHLSSIG